MKSTLAAALVLALTSTLFAGEGDWIQDFDTAVAAARKQGKDLLVDFSGSDWCHWCRKLDEEVFTKDEFLANARKNFVLVTLDFPQGAEAQAKVPNPQRNKELQGKYKIQGFPTVLLMLSDGTVYARTGYRPGGPVKYVEHLETFRTGARAKLLKVLDLVARFAAASDAEKPALREQALVLLEGMQPGAAGADKLAGPVRTALVADPENKQGLKLRAVKALLGAGQTDMALLADARALDPRNEHGMLEQVVLADAAHVNSKEDVIAVLKAIAALDALGPIKDKDLAIEIYARGAFWNWKVTGDLATAKSFAKKAKAIGSHNPRLVAMLDQILGS